MQPSIAIKKNDLKSLFGARLRALRIEKGWTAQQAADELEIDQSYLCRVERGEREVSFALIARIADVYEVDERTLFTFPGESIAHDLDELLRPLPMNAFVRVKTFVEKVSAEYQPIQGVRRHKGHVR